jgi:hypothetical protein
MKTNALLLSWDSHFRAETPIGCYAVIDDPSLVCVRLTFCGTGIALPVGASVDEAKVVAQSDYDRRIAGLLSKMEQDGLKLVPAQPVEAQWSGLARDIMMWMDMDDRTPRGLFFHLKALGRDIPDWLKAEAEMDRLDHVPSKGTRVAIVYKAMLADAPELFHLDRMM